MLARGLLLAVALLACAWFGVGIRQSENTNHATALISSRGPLTAGQARSAASSLSAAAFLNPDRMVDLLRGRLALAQRRPAEAQRIIERVTRAEPQNLQAWLLLAQATLHRHQPMFGVAIKMMARLDPQLK